MTEDTTVLDTEGNPVPEPTPEPTETQPDPRDAKIADLEAKAAKLQGLSDLVGEDPEAIAKLKYALLSQQLGYRPEPRQDAPQRATDEPSREELERMALTDPVGTTMRLAQKAVDQRMAALAPMAQQVVDMAVDNFVNKQERTDPDIAKAVGPRFEAKLKDLLGKNPNAFIGADRSAVNQSLELLWNAAAGEQWTQSYSKAKKDGKLNRVATRNEEPPDYGKKGAPSTQKKSIAKVDIPEEAYEQGRYNGLTDAEIEEAFADDTL